MSRNVPVWMDRKLMLDEAEWEEFHTHYVVGQVVREALANLTQLVAEGPNYASQ